MSAGPAGKSSRQAARPQPSLAGVAELTARDRAYHDLRYRILTGRLAPGTTLLETELAALLNLSRTPVREATIRLAEEGLVTVRPRRGVTVKAFTLADVRDVLNVFSALEIRAVELVARRGLSPAEAARLTQMLDRMEHTTMAGDIVRWSDMDDDWHSTIVSMCGNDRLVRTLGEYWDQQYRARMLIVPLRPRPVASDREHREILAALKAGDREGARRAHQNHRDRADAQQLQLLDGKLTQGNFESWQEVG